jgi:hypothetical protein
MSSIAPAVKKRAKRLKIGPVEVRGDLHCIEEGKRVLTSSCHYGCRFSVELAQCQSSLVVVEEKVSCVCAGCVRNTGSQLGVKAKRQAGNKLWPKSFFKAVSFAFPNSGFDPKALVDDVGCRCCRASYTI